MAGRTGLEPATFAATLSCFRGLGSMVARETWYLGGTWSLAIYWFGFRSTGAGFPWRPVASGYLWLFERVPRG
jgi:hypothetical protein